MNSIEPKLNNTYVVTVQDVYGIDSPSIPEGFEAIEFRIPTASDLYLCSIGDGVRNGALAGSPRIIVRRKKTTRKQYVLTETGEMRRAKAGEWYCDAGGFYRWYGADDSEYTHRILRYQEREIEVDA
jgi:hypothetical protein